MSMAPSTLRSVIRAMAVTGKLRLISSVSIMVSLSYLGRLCRRLHNGRGRVHRGGLIFQMYQGRYKETRQAHNHPDRPGDHEPDVDADDIGHWAGDQQAQR